MKKRILLILFAIIILILPMTYSVYDENTVSEDFKLSDDIEVDAVSTASMSPYEVDNPKREYTEMEIYNMTINALLVMIVLIIVMIVPLVLRKLMGKHIGSE